MVIDKEPTDRPVNSRNFFAELKRRNVFKVALAYAVIAWLLIEVGSILFPSSGEQGSIIAAFVTVLVCGFVVALVVSWAFEMTPQGMKRTENISPNEFIPYWSRRKFATLIATVALAAAGLLLLQLWRAHSGPIRPTPGGPMTIIWRSPF